MLGVGLSVSLGIGGGKAAPPPTVDSFTVEALSDETVTITAFTVSADATHVIVQESATPPAIGDPGWILVASIPTEYTPTAEGDVTLYAFAKGPGGVSAAASDTVTVIPESWVTPGNIGTWEVPWGPYTDTLILEGSAISQATDLQPAASYPATPIAKTKAYPLTRTGADRPEYSSGAITATSQKELYTSDAEAVSHLSGNDTPYTVLYVVAVHATGGRNGLIMRNEDSTHQIRNEGNRYTGTSAAFAVRYDGVHLLQEYTPDSLVDDTFAIVILSYDGVHQKQWVNGVEDTGIGADNIVDALTFTRLQLSVGNGWIKKMALWNRGYLTAQEVYDNTVREGRRWSIPLP